MAKLSATLSLYDNFSKVLNTVNSSMSKASGNMNRFKASVSAPMSNGLGSQMQKEAAKVNQAFNQMNNGTQKTGGLFKRLLSAQLPGKTISSGLSLISNGMRGLLDEALSAADSMTRFKSTMNFAGFKNKEIVAAQKQIQKYANETIYDSQTMTNVTAQLAANGIKNYVGLSKAAGNLNAVAGGNANTFQTVAMVMSQTAGVGRLTSDSWNQLRTSIPMASQAIQTALKEAGAYTGDFQQAMENGEISSDEFNTAITKLGNNPAAVKAAEGIDTFEGSMNQLKTVGINAFSGIVDAIGMSNITGIINSLTSGIEQAIPTIKAVAANMIKVFAGLFNFMKSNSGWLLPLIAGISVFVGTIATINKVSAGVRAMISAFNAVKKVGSIIGGLGKKLFAISVGQSAAATSSAPMVAGETAVGTAAGSAAKQTLALGAAILMIGGGILLAAAGMWILVQATIQLASAGWPAIAVLVGLVAVIALFAAGAIIFGSALTAAAVGMIAFGVAALLVGVAVMLIGVGIMLALVGFTMFATVLPIVAVYGMQAALGMLLMGAALIVVGVGALVAGVGLLILSVALIVLGVGAILAAVGMLLFGAALIMVAMGGMLAMIGLMMVSITIILIATFGMIAAIAMLLLGTALLLVGAGSMLAAVGVIMLGAGLMVMAIGMLIAAPAAMLLGAGLIIVGAGALVAGAGFIILGAGLMVTAVAIMMVAMAIQMLFSVVSSIFSQIVSTVTSAMNNVASAVKNGINRAVEAVKSMGSSLISAGKDFVMGFVNGIKGAIGDAVDAAANMAKSAVNAAKKFLHIHSPSRVMRDQVGKFVGEGMAVGIQDSTSNVTDASSSMAQSAVNAASGFNLPTIGGLGLSEDPGQALANGFMNALTNLKALLSTMGSISGTQVNVRQGIEASANTVVPSAVKSGTNDNSQTQTIHIESGAINIVASGSDTPEDIVRKVEEFIAARQDANLKFG